MYVQSEQNPADILTKQPKAEDLLENQHWWNGPRFLLEPKEEWPFQNPHYNLMPEETMKKEFTLEPDKFKIENVTP